MSHLKITNIAIVLLLGWLSVCFAEEPPPFMGSYVGMIKPPEGDKSKWQRHPPLAARVIGRGGDTYEVQLLPELHKRAQVYLAERVEAQPGSEELTLENGDWWITFTADGAAGTAPGRDNPVQFELKKLEPESPTLGKAPPDGAVVLFDGKNLDQWMHEKRGEELDPTWKILDAGSFEIVTGRGKNAKGGGDLISRQSFGDCRLHLEFKLPYEPGKGGQGRGNSGVFIQGEYEVQILDSYGSAGMWDECGALYKVWPPKVNACAPPGVWQTYDVEFRTARFGDDGKLTAPPVITVYQNGIPIHKNAELHEITQFTWAGRNREHQKDPGPIILQDHGHPVQFRNIWVAPLQ